MTQVYENEKCAKVSKIHKEKFLPLYKFGITKHAYMVFT